MILNAYYDPPFSSHSHGLRPERGCHTAFCEIDQNWSATTWFIEGDMAACFDKLDHEVLLEILRENIRDGRFINLINELLKAGSMEQWTYNETLSGTPQGGILSPLLSNVYLDKFDQFVETVLIPEYTRGNKRERNAEYMKLMNCSSCLRKQGKMEQAEEMRNRARPVALYQCA